MVYIMKFYVDGGCRGNGKPDAIGGAAACLKPRWGKWRYWKRELPSYPYTPTNQRAEITAIILALEQALERYDKLDTSPRLRLKIYADSKYAIGCMNDWIHKWLQNGWINAAGNEVANRDLIEEASDLDDQVQAIGTVEYIWIPRGENQLADEKCNECMDDQEDNGGTARWF